MKLKKKKKSKKNQKINQKNFETNENRNIPKFMGFGKNSSQQ